jgi:Right handed beta helix region
MNDILSNLRKACGAFLIVCASCPALLGQGPLPPPPGPPGPTMKTLDQIDAKLEKRTPISALPFTISTSGSFYLTGNLSGTTGITATVSNVTIDLNGFTLTGPGKSAGGSVSAISGLSDTVVRNGFITGWPGYGVKLGAAAVVERLDVVSVGAGCIQAGEQSQVRNCRVGTGHWGIALGDSSLIEACVVIGNTGTSNTSEGIVVGAYSVVSNSSSSYNSGTGISADPHSVITHCAVSNNGDAGIFAYGNSRVEQCTAHANVGGIIVSSATIVEGCVVTGNTGSYPGIGLFNDSTASGCTVATNVIGISADGDRNKIVQCTVSSNTGQSAIFVNGNGNLIDGNHIRGNSGIGINVPTGMTKNVVIRNEAGGNNPSYSIASGNDAAPITAPASATNPFSNLQN